jgi:DNA-binding MarR family transcriptional regulator
VTSIGQGDGWPSLGDEDVVYHPGEEVSLDIGPVPPGLPEGTNVTMEVDGPSGQPLLVASEVVGSEDSNMTFVFRLPSDSEVGVYDVYICYRKTTGEGELTVGNFTVRTEIRSISEPYPVVPVLVVGSGVLAAGAAAAIALGDASKYRFFAMIAPLFTRLRREDVLSHSVRWQILGYILENPGRHYNQIKRDLDLPNGSLAYHLRVLEKAAKIKTVRKGRLVCFYTYETDVSLVPKVSLSTMDELIIQTIKDNPQVSQKEIALILDEKPDNVGYHLRKMVREGWIDSYTRGRETHYIVSVQNVRREAHNDDERVI